MSKQSEIQSVFVSEPVVSKMSVKEHLEMYWKFFFEKGEKVPQERLPQKQLNTAELFAGKGYGLKASWLGHSSLLINIDGHTVLTDPIFQRKVSPIGPARFNRELPLNVEELPAVDVVIISHDHYDHLNKLSIQQLRPKTGVFIVPVGVGRRLARWGVPDEKIVELNWWDESNPQGNLTVVATPAQHFSGRGLFDRNSTLWASWVIKTPGHRVFFSGDTGYFNGFKEIGNKYGPFDVTFLECGAYNEGWSNIHMFPEQTVQAFFDLGGKVLQPVHLGTFNLALHPWYEPMERVKRAAWRKEAALSTPVMGEVVDYAYPPVESPWWIPAMVRSRNRISQPEMAVKLSQ